MPGVRLGHETLRGVTYTVEHPTRRYKEPYLCPACGTVHLRKTYHLRLDGDGTVIVSREIFQRLRQAGLPGLVVLNEVKHPPNQTLQIDGQRMTFQIVEHKVQGRGQRARQMWNRLTASRAVPPDPEEQ